MENHLAPALYPYNIPGLPLQHRAWKPLWSLLKTTQNRDEQGEQRDRVPFLFAVGHSLRSRSAQGAAPLVANVKARSPLSPASILKCQPDDGQCVHHKRYIQPAEHFLYAVDFAGRYQVTRIEARRVALKSDSAAVWERTWKDETWWKDGEDTSGWS